MTPSKELKKAQPRLYDIIVKKKQNESGDKGHLEAKMGATTSKVDDLNEFTKRRKEEFPDDNDKEKEKEEDDDKKEEKCEEIDITKSSDEDDVTEISPVIKRTKTMEVTSEDNDKEEDEQKEIGPEQGVNEEIIQK